jgi:hypothetical protein
VSTKNGFPAFYRSALIAEDCLAELGDPPAKTVKRKTGVETNIVGCRLLLSNQPRRSAKMQFPSRPAWEMNDGTVTFPPHTSLIGTTSGSLQGPSLSAVEETKHWESKTSIGTSQNSRSKRKGHHCFVG